MDRERGEAVIKYDPSRRVSNEATIPGLHPKAAWIFRRLLCGRSLNGELIDLPVTYRPLAKRLDEASPEGRQAIWDYYLSFQPDPDTIISAVAAANPEEPFPEADPNAIDDGWGPIRLRTLPPAKPFPLNVLPRPARVLAETAAESIACPADFPAVGTLAAASGTIGRSACLLIKPGYFASASLYVALVGNSSSGKSPALEHALKPVHEFAKSHHDQWRKDKSTWEAAERGSRGEEPIPKRIVSTDATTEALGPILAKNPRGLIVSPDEMTKWVLSMDQYKGGKGGDRPFYLSAWNGAPVYVDRAKYMKEPIAVPHPFLTVVGGMTPSMLSTLSLGPARDDGFMARLLFAYPERLPRRHSDQGMPDEVIAEWQQLIEALCCRQMRAVDSTLMPWVVKMTPDARRAWSEWCQAHYEEQAADDFPDSLEGAWGKLEEYAPRLGLILHLMNLASDPTQAVTDPPPDLPKQTIEDAFSLVAYFKAHALRVYASVGGKCDDGGDDVRAIVKWLRRNSLSDFSERDITRDLRRFRDDRGALSDAVNWLNAHNVIRPRQEPEGSPKPGRKHSAIYDVNPSFREAPQN